MTEPVVTATLSTEEKCAVNADNEVVPLVPKKTSSTWWSRCVLRYKTTRKCVSSKSALLILFWSLVFGGANPDLFSRDYTYIYSLAGYGLLAILFCFFPLAGFLADVKYGRYKVVVRSMYLILISYPTLTIAGGIFYGTMVGFTSASDDGSCNASCFAVLVMISVVLLLAYIAFCTGMVGFTANAVQFGMDQLHDSPGEDRTLFIHWYVWVYFLIAVLGQLAWNPAIQYPYNFENIVSQTHRWYNFVGYVFLGLTPVGIVFSLIVTLCLAKHRRNWFLIEPGTVNPYKLVYSVTKFARQHKTPVRRSAFTYCEDEIPTGLDLGKEKYGGPFSTEQVEDVKVFYGLLKVLFSFGAVFFLDFASNSVLPYYALHTAAYYKLSSDSNYNLSVTKFNGTLPEHILLNSGLLSPLLVTICLPLYLCLLRPFISGYVPGMLKRMGLGTILTFLSLTVTFSMDIAAHQKTKSTHCMFDVPDYSDTASDEVISVPEQSPLFLIVPLVLTSLSHMLIYTAVFEFICSQSPHSMKGLLIGLLYAIKGLYQLLATLVVVPFAVGYTSHPSHVGQMSCGFYYYLVNIVIGLITVLTYMWVAKKYKYRERDEICEVHRYAEEYYSNPQQEQYYDYY